MHAHKTEAVVTENGKLILENLPFNKGEFVEVIILENGTSSSEFKNYSLAKKVIKYDEPLEPATDIQDWEVLQ